MRLLRDQLTKPRVLPRIMSQSLVNDLYLPHRCDVWRAAPLIVGPQGAAMDRVYLRVGMGIACYFAPTPEKDAPAEQGRTKIVNIFTLDKFFFALDFDVRDTDCLKLRLPGHPQDGNFWKVQGNPQTQYNALQIINRRMVYTKTGPPPNGVS